MGLDRFFIGRFGIATGGALDIVGLSMNPALIICGYTFPSFMLLMAGFFGSFINTRIILPCSLLALVFLVPRQNLSPAYKIIIIFFLLVWQFVNVAYMYIGFMVEGGIR